MINQMKSQILTQMIIQTQDLDKLKDAIYALDETAHSGQNDLYDQVSTMTQVISDLESVLVRAQNIIPS